jgi:hypothetical protein
MSDLTQRINLSDPGHYSFIMPEGSDNTVEVHLWGAGGGTGAGGAAGGGGGYAKSFITVSAGDTVDIGVGGVGQNAASVNTAGVGGVSMTSKYRGGNGGGRGSWCGNVDGPMASAGGGGATAIDVNGASAAVAGGGGGGGGYGHKKVKYGGYPAGLYPDLIVSGTNGATATWGGGGGGGYNGGASGYASGHAVIGGFGGTNFGTVVANGDGTITGGVTPRLIFGLPPNVGNAGFNGYVILVFTRNKTLQYKQANGNIRVTLSNVATISTGSTIQQEYTESAQGNAVVKQGTAGGNAIIVSYLDSNIFINDSGNISSSPWTGNIIVGDLDSNVYPIATETLGDWVSVANVYYKATEAGVLNNTSDGALNTQSFKTAGTYTYTVPPYVRMLTVKACGGGGAGGSGDGGKNNDGPGYGGGGSNLVTEGPFAVTPGQVLTVTVGRGGFGSRNSGSGLYGGGEAGRPTTITGAGVNFSFDGGGGGGGHPGWGGAGESFPGSGGVITGGGPGANGAASGGYPSGGKSNNGGANGGNGGPHNMQAGTNGGSGSIEISYRIYFYTPGTWVPVQDLHYKNNGTWQNLVSSEELIINKIS